MIGKDINIACNFREIMKETHWLPLVKFLLAVSEREPVTGNDLISYITQEYRMSTHTYVKARKQALSRGLVLRTPTGKKGRSARYSLTMSGRKHLNKFGESLKDSLKGFSSKEYFFKFGEEGLGRINFSIKSNLPSPLLRGPLYHEGILALLFQNLTDHFMWNPESIMIKGNKIIPVPRSLNVETEINIKISAKGVDDEVVYLMRKLQDYEKEEELEKPDTIMEIDEIISKNPKIRDVLGWHLSNVYGRSEPDFDYEDGEPVEWWLSPFPWEVLDFDSTQSGDPISCEYWGSLIFQHKEEAVRDLETYFLFMGVQDSNLMDFRNALVINQEFFGSDIDDYTFLKMWEKIRIGSQTSPTDYEDKFADDPFRVFGLSSLIDREIFKKWIMKGRPSKPRSYDIVSFLVSVMRRAFGPQKETLKSWTDISKDVLEYAEEYLRQTRFDIIEKSHG